MHDTGPTQKDPILEALIIQDQTNRSALYEAARAAITYRDQAEKGWSSYHGLQALVMANGLQGGAHAPMQPLPMMMQAGATPRPAPGVPQVNGECSPPASPAPAAPVIAGPPSHRRRGGGKGQGPAHGQ